LVAAHNDFAAWNIRVRRNVVSLFDWEFAADEQFPLFDPLHFALMPLALSRSSVVKLTRTMNRTLQLCRQEFGEELCSQAQMQSLAYFANVCSLYLYADRGEAKSNPVLESYARMIDLLSDTSSARETV
jgi:hypothetical protein